MRFLTRKNIQLKINITMGYTSVFTTSVLKGYSKLKKIRGDSFIDFVRRNIRVVFLLHPYPLLEKCQPQK